MSVWCLCFPVSSLPCTRSGSCKRPSGPRTGSELSEAHYHYPVLPGFSRIPFNLPSQASARVCNRSPRQPRCCGICYCFGNTLQVAGLPRHHTAGAQASHKLRVRQKLTTLEMVFVMQLESPSDLPAFSAADFWQPCCEQGTQSRNSPKSKCHRHSQSYLNSVVPLGWTNFWFISWL